MNLAFHVVHNSKSTNFVVGFPSGQREQTVNLPSSTSKVRILPPPPSQILQPYLPIKHKSNIQMHAGKDREPSTRRFEPSEARQRCAATTRRARPKAESSFPHHPLKQFCTIPQNIQTKIKFR